MTNKETDQYNLRQYERMLSVIDDYKNGHIGFRQLIFDFEALIDVLEDVPRDKRDLLFSHWGLLEEVYAFILDKGMPELDQHCHKLIADALNALTKIVNQELFLLRTKQVEVDE